MSPAPDGACPASEPALDLTVALEERFERTPDGRTWTRSPSSYSFWSRYLEVFRSVRVVARIRAVQTVDPSWSEVGGPGVTLVAVPYYVGPREYLRRRAAVQRVLAAALPARSALIIRASSVLGSALVRGLGRSGRPFGVEVVADPHDVFAPGAVAHPLRALFRWRFARVLRRQCARAVAVSYVTQEALQRRYPGGPRARTFACSDVELPEAAFAAGPRTARSGEAFVLIGIGSLQQRYKGFDVLIQAVARCRRRGLDLRLVLLGDGKHRAELASLAASEGVGERVEFAGWVASKAEVRSRLDGADLFVLSSRAEGLPRALVEAMARGLPCIGTRVGGVPELLTADCLVPANDAEALAEAIGALLRSPERLTASSARNWTKASTEFSEEVLRARRIEFYRVVRDRTAAWLER